MSDQQPYWFTPIGVTTEKQWVAYEHVSKTVISIVELGGQHQLIQYVDGISTAHGFFETRHDAYRFLLDTVSH